MIKKKPKEWLQTEGYELYTIVDPDDNLDWGQNYTEDEFQTLLLNSVIRIDEK